MRRAERAGAEKGVAGLAVVRRGVAGRGRAVAFVIAGAGVVYACAEPVRIFVAAPYDSEGDCLGPDQGLDLVRTKSDGGACAVVCLVDTRGLNGAAPGVFVTNECPPYPRGFEASATAPECAGALAARAAGRLCGDGGARDAAADAPAEPPVDAAPDGDADARDANARAADAL